VTKLAFLGSLLPADWREGVLGDVTSKVGSGATPRGGAAVYVDAGMAFIRSQNVYDHRFSPLGLVHITDEAAHQLRGVTVEKSDVLLNITGDSILRTCQVPASVLPARVSQHVAIVRPNGVVDSTFLQKWLSLPAMKAYMLNHSSGGTRKAITKGHILSFPIPIPPIAEQHEIGATLDVLDDKIKSNRRAIDHLQRLSQLHFKRAVESGDPELVPLGKVAIVTKGRSYKSAELLPSSTALVTLKSIDRHGGYKADGLKPYVGSFKPEQVVQPGELVVAQTDLTQGAEVVGRGVRVPPVSEFETLVASLDLAIVRPCGEMPLEYLYGLLTSEAFRQHCRSHTTGTTVLHLSKDAIPTWLAPVVASDEQAAYAAIARALLAKMDALREESVILESMRDALLPELLSGRLRVSEAREVVEAAA
jgi:type I restriction enzyme, S subunit